MKKIVLLFVFGMILPSVVLGMKEPDDESDRPKLVLTVRAADPTPSTKDPSAENATLKQQLAALEERAQKAEKERVEAQEALKRVQNAQEGSRLAQGLDTAFVRRDQEAREVGSRSEAGVAAAAAGSICSLAESGWNPDQVNGFLDQAIANTHQHQHSDAELARAGLQVVQGLFNAFKK
jgi:hypothetical protein